MTEETTQNETKYPGVAEAYPIAINSYEVSMKRLDTMNGRLQTMLAFIVSITVAAATIGGGQGNRLSSPAFLIAMVPFVASIVVGIHGQLFGQIRLLRPQKLWDQWLAEGPWTFKKDIIYDAGCDFDQNMNLVENKWRCSVKLSVLFALEAVLLLVWVAAGRL